MSKELEKLIEKQAQLQERISKIKARERKRKKSQDDRRKILIGAWALEKSKRDPEFDAMLRKELDPFLTRQRDRELFGLSDNTVLDHIDEQGCEALTNPEGDSAKD